MKVIEERSNSNHLSCFLLWGTGYLACLPHWGKVNARLCFFSWLLCHSQRRAGAWSLFVARSRIENLCAHVQWLQSMLCHWSWSLPKLLLPGSWAKTKALGLSGGVGCSESLKLVLAHLVWHLHSCQCRSCSLQPLKPRVCLAYPSEWAGHPLAKPARKSRRSISQ